MCEMPLAVSYWASAAGLKTSEGQDEDLHVFGQFSLFLDDVSHCQD